MTRVAAALSGVALLAFAVGTTVAGARDVAMDDLDQALESTATSHAGALQEYFERAESVNLLLAHDSAFAQFAPGPGAPSGPEARPATTAANGAMAYLEELYPGRIGEACLIDATGTEIARVVGGVVAPASELSDQEAAAPFFGPTLELPPDRVHQAAPYLSPDTHEWVVSNSTPLHGPSGPWGLVHFEIALESFQPERRTPGTTVAIVDTDTGRVILETGRTLDAEVLGRPAPAGLLAAVTARTTGTVGDQRVAVAEVAVQPDNVNSWVVVVSGPAGTGWWTWLAPAPVAMTFAALLLLVLAGLSARSRTRALRAAGLTDELTGLPNRRLLLERLNQVLALGQRRGTGCAVLLIDLDRFKEVNDTLGHQYGDQLLQAVAHRLRSTFRDIDTVARLGGDEFAVLLSEVGDEGAAVELAAYCAEALDGPFVIDGLTLYVEASVGLAMGPQHGADCHSLLRAADVAMYESKETKRGVVVYTSEVDVNSPTRLALLGGLRRALETDQLVLHYQPKVDLRTGLVTGVEALVRWQHPDRGLVPPAEFVPAAESSGLIAPLTARVLELAVAEARRWSRRGLRLQVAVNLSARCLGDPALADRIRALLEVNGLPAELLRLEITESSIMRDPERALATLTTLRRLGVRVSIDDFGTGHSSMSHLRRLPVDELKVDRSFVTDMLAADDDDDLVLVRSAIDLGHDLGMTVVAEGVEDQATLVALGDLGCDAAQGYHLAHPMDPATFLTWMDTRRWDHLVPVPRNDEPPTVLGGVGPGSSRRTSGDLPDADGGERGDDRRHRDARSSSGR